jgi:hypothetical protein
MVSVFLSVALAFVVAAGAVMYSRLRKQAAEPDYFIPMLTQSSPGTFDERGPEAVVVTRSGRKIRALDLEQIRSAGL